MTKAGMIEQSGHRARGFPAISVDEAIARAKKLFFAENKHVVTNDVAAGHWGYTTTSSSGRTSLAALKKYGLLEEVGGGMSGKIRVSRLALDIILHDDDEHRQEQLKAIRTAALMPLVHSELWEMWGPRLPSDGSMRSHLIREMGFNETSAAAFIKEFKRTIAVAKLSQADRVDSDEEGTESKDGPLPEALNAATTTKALPVVIGNGVLSAPNAVAMRDTPSSEMREEIFTLDEGQVFLRYPSRLNAQSYDDMKDWLDLVLRKAKRSIRVEDNGETVGLSSWTA